MIICNECGAPQPEGALFCSECGRSLINTTGQMTAELPFVQFGHHVAPLPQIVSNLEPNNQQRQVTFVIPGSRRRFTVGLAGQIRIGRADPEADISPELDLSDDDGIEKGVSRLHAAIQTAVQGVVLIDLNSTNGTLLNNHRLKPELPYSLKSGDEIHFGDLLVHVFLD